MDDRNGTPSSQQPTGRETLLAVTLAVFVGFGAVIFLVFVTGGFFAWVILIAMGLALLGGLHYLVWGCRMPANPQSDAEQPADEEEEPPAPTPWERRF